MPVLAHDRIEGLLVQATEATGLETTTRRLAKLMARRDAAAGETPDRR
jgi:hypothetical protein